MSARVAALANNIKLADLQKWEAETTFESMANYAMVNQRVRFLKGFDDTALADLNSQLFSVIVRARGLQQDTLRFCSSVGCIHAPPQLLGGLP